MDFSKEEIEKSLQEGASKTINAKKLKKSASYLSMENLDIEEKEPSEDEEQPDEPLGGGGAGTSSSKREQEQINLEPTYILDQAFKRMNAVGSSTALVAIRN
jgi:hypothetical protein